MSPLRMCAPCEAKAQAALAQTGPDNWVPAEPLCEDPTCFLFTFANYSDEDSAAADLIALCRAVAGDDFADNVLRLLGEAS